MLGNLVGAVIFLFDLWAIVQIVQSAETTGTKALWVILVVLLPLLGLIIWYFAGPRPGASRA